MTSSNNLNQQTAHPFISLLLLPSFYLSCSWTIWLTIYLLRLVPWQLPKQESIIIFFSVLAVSCLSTIKHHKQSQLAFERLKNFNWKISKQLILITAGLGIFGILFHMWQLSSSFYGLQNLLSAFKQASYEVRWENSETTSFGIQLSYFGWIAAGLISLGLGAKKLSWQWCILVVLLLLINISMVDRTRPFWMLFTSVSLYILGRQINSWIKLSIVALTACSTLLTIFGLIALWTGKVGEHTPGVSELEATTDNLLIYGGGGFAYFDTVTSYFHEANFLPLRSLYPLTKILAAIDLSPAPPSQILPFEAVPFDVNVGTFLEPLYMDGGWIYLLVGVPILIYFVDLLALFFISSRKQLSAFAWSSLCFAAAMAFFSAHFMSTPLWLFCLVALVENCLSKSHG